MPHVQNFPIPAGGIPAMINVVQAWCDVRFGHAISQNICDAITAWDNVAFGPTQIDITTTQTDNGALAFLMIMNRNPANMAGGRAAAGLGMTQQIAKHAVDIEIRVEGQEVGMFAGFPSQILTITPNLDDLPDAAKLANWP